MIVKFSFDYQTKVTQEKAEELARLINRDWCSIVEQKGDKPEVDEHGLYTLFHFREYEGDIQELIKHSVPFNVKGIGSGSSLDLLLSYFRNLEKKIDALGDERQAYNERVSVHVPGEGLLKIRYAKVEYDCCTDLLQELIEKGWRIIAACPQPNQRRPDYVLGRADQP